jgi:hypothetical protein
MHGPPAGLAEESLVGEKQGRLAVSPWPCHAYVGTIDGSEMQTVELGPSVDKAVLADGTLEWERTVHGDQYT